MKYLKSNNLESHISTITDIVNSHYKRKSTSVRTTPKTVKKRGNKEILFENQYFIIVKDYHTKEKVDIWVLKLKRKIWLEKDEFAEFKEFIEGYDGYYSGFSGGFIFKSMPITKTLKEAEELLEDLVG